MRSLIIPGEFRGAAPLQQIKSAEVVWVSDLEASWVPSPLGFSGKSHWEETPRQTQNLLEGLYFLPDW